MKIQNNNIYEVFEKANIIDKLIEYVYKKLNKSNIKDANKQPCNSVEIYTVKNKLQEPKIHLYNSNEKYNKPEPEIRREILNSFRKSYIYSKVNTILFDWKARFTIFILNDKICYTECSIDALSYIIDFIYVDKYRYFIKHMYNCNLHDNMINYVFDIINAREYKL